MANITRHYFVAVQPLEVELLHQCGAKNVLMSYWYVNNILKKHPFEELAEMFDSVFMDSGAYSAYTLGSEVSMEEYCKFLLNNKSYIDVAAQLDVYRNVEKTKENYITHLDNGTDFVLPILTGYWPSALVGMEDLIKGDYVLLGGAHFWRKFYDMENTLKNLPTKYRYHGFALGKTQFYKSRLFYSIDSSSWTMIVRSAMGRMWTGTEFEQFSLTTRNRGDMQKVNWGLNRYADDVKRCGIDVDLLLKGNYKQLLKFNVITYYKAFFKDLGQDMFDANFRF